MRRFSRYFLALFLVLCLLTPPSFGAPRPGTKDYRIRRSALEFHPTVNLKNPLMQKRIYFWKKIFSWYGSNVAVLHHKDYPWIVYKVIRFRKPIYKIQRNRASNYRYNRRIKREMARQRQKLLGLRQKLRKKGAKLTKSERRLYKKFKGLPRKAIFKAHYAGKFRVQRGMKNDFQIALKRSKRFLPGMERIFKKKGLPVELSRLPFIESMFNRHARSSVGAVGMWQFMPATARMYGLKVNRRQDDRKIPMRSTWAAARFLKDYYRTFKSWPLAITAYNHGITGIRRATRQLRTKNINKIIARYNGRAFGFAAENFFAEFMAAVELEKYTSQYFGKNS